MDQAIDVLVAAALPRTVRVAEVDRHTGLLRDFCMPCHLPSLVVSHAPAYRQRHAIQRCAEPLHRRGRCRVIHLHQHQIAAGTLDQGAHRRGVGLTLDQIALPVTGHQPIFDLWRMHMDADHVGDLATPIHSARAWLAGCLALLRADDQLLAQFADWQGVDRVVDRLATDVGIFELGGIPWSAACRQAAREKSVCTAGRPPYRTVRSPAPMLSGTKHLGLPVPYWPMNGKFCIHQKTAIKRFL